MGQSICFRYVLVPARLCPGNNELSNLHVMVWWLWAAMVNCKTRLLFDVHKLFNRMPKRDRALMGYKRTNFHMWNVDYHIKCKK